MSWHNKSYHVETIRLLAQTELSRPIFDFADGATEDKRTRQCNGSAFDDYCLAPKPINGAFKRDLSIDLFS